MNNPSRARKYVRRICQGAALLGLLLALVPPLPAREAAPAARPVGEILKAFVEDFRSDPAAGSPIVFGITVNGADEPEWQVVVAGRKDAAGRFEAELGEGA